MRKTFLFLSLSSTAARQSQAPKTPRLSAQSSCFPLSQPVFNVCYMLPNHARQPQLFPSACCSFWVKAMQEHRCQHCLWKGLRKERTNLCLFTWLGRDQLLQKP